MNKITTLGHLLQFLVILVFSSIVKSAVYRIHKHLINHTGPSGARTKSITPSLSTKYLINVQINAGLPNIRMKILVRTKAGLRVLGAGSRKIFGAPFLKKCI